MTGSLNRLRVFEIHSFVHEQVTRRPGYRSLGVPVPATTDCGACEMVLHR